MPSEASEGAVLGFDTSGPWIAAALIRGDAVLAQREMALAKGQGEALMPLLEALLEEAGLGWAELSAIGAGTGPGNFTGIRLTIAAARGLALGLRIPAIGVDRFEAMALNGPALPVVIPALRGQVWVRAPGAAPVLHDTAPGEGIGDTLTPPAQKLAVAIARLADARRHAPAPRPAPLYLREADAAPPSEAPPVLLD
ncbi:MAG: tRNA (adenosine(37)-N6)-threonylcarbamoyltransferase complex dimerization subunit type 1 TsaB [Pararhodobacter sp.]